MYMLYAVLCVVRESEVQIIVVKCSRFGMSVDVALEKLNMSGVIQLIVTLNQDTAFPHVLSASLSFVKK